MYVPAPPLQGSPQPDGTATTEYDVLVPDLAQQFAAHYNAKHWPWHGPQCLIKLSLIAIPVLQNPVVTFSEVRDEDPACNVCCRGAAGWLLCARVTGKPTEHPSKVL
ncbi:hypothetical protein ABQE45_18070 [Mycobacteroides chelonae]